MKRRRRSRTKPARLLPALLAGAAILAGFALLMVRLEVTREGYRLSVLRLEMEKLQRENQRLRLDAAELSSVHDCARWRPDMAAASGSGAIVMMR